MKTPYYTEFLDELRRIIIESKTKALLQVNRELLFLYWNIGKKIVAQQQEKGWGAKVIESLAQDLSAAFPNMKGFSLRNLKNMQKFALAYPDFEFVQTVSAQLSWSHHILILDKFKDQNTRLWYMQ